jgi:hypothetical protein
MVSLMKAFLPGKPLQRRLEVALAELGQAGHGLFLDADVAAHHFIHSGGHGAVCPFEVFLRNDGIDVSGIVGVRHMGHVGNELLQIGAQPFNVLVDEGLLTGKLLQRRLEGALAELGNAGYGLFLDADVAADHPVDTRRHLLIDTTELAGINCHIDVAQIMLMRHVANLFHQTGQCRDALVQVLLDGVEITVVGVADLRRQVSLADSIYVFAGYR